MVARSSSSASLNLSEQSVSSVQGWAILLIKDSLGHYLSTPPLKPDFYLAAGLYLDAGRQPSAAVGQLAWAVFSSGVVTLLPDNLSALFHKFGNVLSG